MGSLGLLRVSGELLADFHLSLYGFPIQTEGIVDFAFFDNPVAERDGVRLDGIDSPTDDDLLVLEFSRPIEFAEE